MAERRTRRRVLLRDVAERAGVSPTTASFVLAGRNMRISEETRDRVRRSARELDYRPNLTARSLRSRDTRTIALVTHTIMTSQYSGDLVRGTLAAAIAHRQLLLVAETEHDTTIETRVVEELVGRQVAGFIYATMSYDLVALPRVLDHEHVVLLNCRSGTPVPTVIGAEADGGRAAARVLLEAGHDTGIHVVGDVPDRVLPARERMAGIADELAAAGTAPAGHLACEWWPESAYDAVSALLAGGGRPTALVCLNDRIAFGAYQALADAGLRVPDDVSVVSFDDSDLASWLRPGLTSVALQHAEMGRLAVELLVDGDGAPEVHRVPMPVRRRGSVAPPRRG